VPSLVRGSFTPETNEPAISSVKHRYNPRAATAVGVADVGVECGPSLHLVTPRQKIFFVSPTRLTLPHASLPPPSAGAGVCIRTARHAGGGRKVVSGTCDREEAYVTKRRRAIVLGHRLDAHGKRPIGIPAKVARSTPREVICVRSVSSYLVSLENIIPSYI